jgi:hypothetical protein
VISRSSLEQRPISPSCCYYVQREYCEPVFGLTQILAFYHLEIALTTNSSPIYNCPLLLRVFRLSPSCPLYARATILYTTVSPPLFFSLPHPTASLPPPDLEVAVAEPEPNTPMLNIISPTPRAFTFPMNVHSPSPSPSNSPFEPDLGPLTFSTPPPPSRKTHTPSSSISSNASLTLSPDVPATPSSSHRRRRSTVSDISERRPKKGDEDYIKRPENAFILFRRKCCEDRNLALGAGDAGEGDGSAPPTKKQRQADLSKTISQQWKSLSAEERQYWEDLAKEKKVRTSVPALVPFSTS